MRTICIGDVHGCLEQLDELLRMVEYVQGRDRLVLLGDLMDKGPDPVGVVRRAREIGALCVMGNHDEKHVRWRRYEDRKVKTGQANPMRPFDLKRLAENAALSDEDVEWLANLPTMLRIDEDALALHGGLEPRYAIDRQDPKKVLRCRFVNAAGEMVPITSDVDQPAETRRWAEVCTEPVHVFYGHHCLTLDEATVEFYEAPDGRRWLRAACDAACAYGGSLAAAITTPESRARGDVEVVKVKGVQYADPWMGDE